MPALTPLGVSADELFVDDGGVLGAADSTGAPLLCADELFVDDGGVLGAADSTGAPLLCADDSTGETPLAGIEGEPPFSDVTEEEFGPLEIAPMGADWVGYG